MEQQSAAPKETLALVNFLRSSSALRTHAGILNGKRVEYFKGKHAVEALTGAPYQALAAKGKVPPAADEEEAAKVLHDTIRFAFFLRADRGDKIKARDANGASAAGGGRLLRINPMQTFQSDMVRVSFWILPSCGTLCFVGPFPSPFWKGSESGRSARPLAQSYAFLLPASLRNDLFFACESA